MRDLLTIRGEFSSLISVYLTDSEIGVSLNKNNYNFISKYKVIPMQWNRLRLSYSNELLDITINGVNVLRKKIDNEYFDIDMPILIVGGNTFSGYMDNLILVDKFKNKMNPIHNKPYINVNFHAIKKKQNINCQDKSILGVGHIRSFNGNVNGFYSYDSQPSTKIIDNLVDYINNEEFCMVVFLGDTVNELNNQSINYLNLLKNKIKSEVRFLFGNHEKYPYINVDEDLFLRLNNSSYKGLFSINTWEDVYIDGRSTRFVYLDSNDFISDDFDKIQENLKFLEVALNHDNIIVFLHHGIYLDNDEYYIANGYEQSYGKLFRKHYEPIFSKNKVKFVISGDGGYNSKFYFKTINAVKYYQTGFGKHTDPKATPLHGLIINDRAISDIILK